jgi:DNA-binding response OmpR family regulator
MEPNVLLLEDNYTLRRLYSRALQRGGVKVTEAENLQTARQLIEAHRFDLVVCDIQLTDGIATDFIVELKAKNFGVLAMSSDDNYRITCELLGIEGFMQKPIPTRTLVPAVTAAIKKRASLSGAI